MKDQDGWQRNRTWQAMKYMAGKERNNFATAFHFIQIPGYKQTILLAPAKRFMIKVVDTSDSLESIYKQKKNCQEYCQ